MAIRLNNKGLSNGKAKAKAGDINKTASWSFSSGDGNKLLGGKNGTNWTEFGRWHLGEDTSATPKTKARYKYPIGKNGKIYLSALRAIRTRSAQAGAASIFKAAGELLEMAKKKTEQKTGERPFEVRSIGELRSVSDDGIIEAYLTKWNTVDEYRSTFREGAFKKTFQERGDKIKLIWDHDHLIGRVLEAREDQHGPWIKGQINMETTAGKDAHAHCKAKDVDAFSFGFNCIQDNVVDGIRDISEVKCWECGPSIFPANEEASIVSVRSTPDGPRLIKSLEALQQEIKVEVRAKEVEAGPEEILQRAVVKMQEQFTKTMDSMEVRSDVDNLEDSEALEDSEKAKIPEDENRATDFDETVLIAELTNRGYKLFSALDQTLFDIWWNPMPEEESRVSLIDDAIQKFHGAYVEWANDYVNYFNTDTTGQRSIPGNSEGNNEIAAALFEHSQGDLDKLARSTSLTINELDGLRSNKLLPMESRAKLVELPSTIQKAHQKIRSEAVSQLCNELRHGGFNDAERSRFTGLLGIENKNDESDDFTSAINDMVELRDSLKKEN